MLVKNLKIAEIAIGNRHRKDFGDLEALAESISTEGLLQPIGVTKENVLVFGQRRLKAVLQLGWDTVPASIVDISSIVAGEYAENELRKDFTLSERDAIRRAIAQSVGKRQGMRTDIELVGNSPQVETTPDKGEKTRDFAAKQAGFHSTDEARAVSTVVDRGVPELVEAMDEGELPVSVAAKLAQLPPDEQMEALAGGKKAVREAIAEVKEPAKPQNSKGERLKRIADELFELVDRPSMTISISKVKKKVSQLRDMINKLYF